ncbi:MAG: hypothetical protein ACTSVU_08470 [Promethearchaeota archaeon]
MNLSELLEQTEKLKVQIENGKTNLIDYNLQDLFLELKSLISPDDLETGISVMENGTLLLEEKLDEIKRFILIMAQKEKISQFLDQNQDDHNILNNLLIQNWINPYEISSLSPEFLSRSWKQLVFNKIIRTKEEVIEFHKINQETKNRGIQFVGAPFEEKMQHYFQTILSSLPTTIDQLINASGDKKKYFENFSYILHLLQEGYLLYDPNTKIFSIESK